MLKTGLHIFNSTLTKNNMKTTQQNANKAQANKAQANKQSAKVPVTPTPEVVNFDATGQVETGKPKETTGTNYAALYDRYRAAIQQRQETAQTALVRSQSVEQAITSYEQRKQVMAGVKAVAKMNRDDIAKRAKFIVADFFAENNDLMRQVTEQPTAISAPEVLAFLAVNCEGDFVLERAVKKLIVAKIVSQKKKSVEDADFLFAWNDDKTEMVIVDNSQRADKRDIIATAFTKSQPKQ